MNKNDQLKMGNQNGANKPKTNQRVSEEKEQNPKTEPNERLVWKVSQGKGKEKDKKRLNS